MCRDEHGLSINNSNGGVRRVNAAIVICKTEPPVEFSRSRPLQIKAHFNAHRDLLAGHDLCKGSGDTMDFNKHAAHSQAEHMARYYYVWDARTLC